MLSCSGASIDVVSYGIGRIGSSIQVGSFSVRFDPNILAAGTNTIGVSASYQRLFAKIRLEKLSCGRLDLYLQIIANWARFSCSNLFLVLWRKS